MARFCQRSDENMLNIAMKSIIQAGQPCSVHLNASSNSFAIIWHVNVQTIHKSLTEEV
jgi:hypothetical protein